MGYSVLYVAFGVVALWLLGEVLLQYKARLRWRVLAFAGFMCVVAGVAGRQIAVIVLGALAFGTGQSFVTLSYKRGFSTGWALGGRPGSSRRRKVGGARPAEPVLEVTPVEPEYDPVAAAPAGGDVLARDDDAELDEQVYQPVPMHDDSGEYPLFDTRPAYTPDPYTSGGYEGYGAQGYGGWDGEPQPAAATASYDGGAQQGGYDASGGWGGGQEQGWNPGYGEQYAQGGGYGYPQEQPAAAGYDASYGGGYAGYGGQDAAPGYGTGNGSGGDGYGGTAAGAGDWSGYAAPSYDQPAADPYAAYGQDQQQPYIPQQHQPSYEQPGQDQQPQQGREQYADPYDPYRY